MRASTTLLLLTWIAIAGLGITLAGVVRQVHQLSKMDANPRRIGPRIGSVAPTLAGQPSEGVWLRPTLVVFASADCESCEAALERLSWVRTDLKSLDVVAIFPFEARFVDPSRVRVVDHAQSVFASFEVKATPFAVLIDSRGRVEKAGLVGSKELVDEFVRSAHVMLDQEMEVKVP